MKEINLKVEGMMCNNCRTHVEKALNSIDGVKAVVTLNPPVATVEFDKDEMPLVAMHWEHRFNHMVQRYNDIYRIQIPNITPHVCRHTYCSNMAKSGMNPKTLQYLMGHSEIGVTLNTYTHLGLEDATDELKRMEELENARKELDKTSGRKTVTQKMFRAV